MSTEAKWNKRDQKATFRKGIRFGETKKVTEPTPESVMGDFTTNLADKKGTDGAARSLLPRYQKD